MRPIPLVSPVHGIDKSRFSTSGWINVIEHIHALVLPFLLPVVLVTGRQARCFAYYKIGVFYGAGGLKPGTRLAILAGGFYRKHLGIATQVEKRENLSCADGYDL